MIGFDVYEILVGMYTYRKFFNEIKKHCEYSDVQTALVNPGPDLVICDEGHRIKNSHASISQVGTTR